MHSYCETRPGNLRLAHTIKRQHDEAIRPDTDTRAYAAKFA